MSPRSSRRCFLAVTGTVAVAGCVGIRDRTKRDQSTTTPPLTEFDLPLAYTLTDVFDESVVSDWDPDDPPEVGNSDAAIDDPSFLSPDDAEVTGHEIVFGVEKNGEAKAYPQYILVWNEVVNDHVGGEAICVSYCPLTGTAIGYERGASSFGMSNKLVNSNLILYDRATETWWPQMLGVGIANELRGKALVETEVVWTTWDRWRKMHPETKVLSENTGVIRDYGTDPFGSYEPEPGGYYASPDPAHTVMYEDDRLHSKEVVVGARTADGAVAFVKETMRREKVATEQVGDIPYTAFYDDRLDIVSVYRNPDSALFSYEGGQYLGPDGDSYRANEIPLNAVNAFDAMWFAWAAYFPNTELSAPEDTFF